MRKQNKLFKQINEGMEEYFLGVKQKRKKETEKLYEYLINGLGNEIEWTKKWIEREYEILGEDFAPEKISERAREIYDFIRNPIQTQIEKYQEGNK